MRKKSFWLKKKVLVTGHEGFLGSWLTKNLVELGANVVGIDKLHHSAHPVLSSIEKDFVSIKGNIANLNLMQQVMDIYKPQVIFHLAAEAIVGKANKTPIKTFQSNIQGTWNILEASKGLSGLQAVVVASSDKAYGSHEVLPYTEKAALQGEHPYDVSKSCADLICRTYYKTFNLPVVVTRCGNIYGPGDMNFSRIVPDAVCKILKNETFLIRSDGTFTRDYIFVQDIVDAYLCLAENIKNPKVAGEAFNFSCEDPLSVLELYDAIKKAAGKRNASMRILNEARFEIKHQYLSAKKARQVLGWKPSFSLEKGLKESVRWYKQYLERN